MVALPHCFLHDMATVEQIEFIAGQLLPQFTPKDNQTDTLTFQFTMVPNKTYRVNYAKQTESGKPVWKFLGYEEVAE